MPPSMFISQLYPTEMISAEYRAKEPVFTGIPRNYSTVPVPTPIQPSLFVPISGSAFSSSRKLTRGSDIARLQLREVTEAAQRSQATVDRF